MKFKIFLFAVLLLGLSVNAQTPNRVSIYGNDGSITTLPTRAIKEVTFSGNQMTVAQQDGATQSFDVDNVDNVMLKLSEQSTLDNPITVSEAIATIRYNEHCSGWVHGYIVGAVAPEVSEVKNNSDIEWGAPTILNNTLVIGSSPNTRDINDALIIFLPPQSDLRRYVNLSDNPQCYKKEIWLKGTFDYVLGSYGIKDNNGSKNEFYLDIDIFLPGDGSEERPFKVEDVIAGATGYSVWVEGYIVGYIDGMTIYDGAQFNPYATTATNFLLAESPDVTDYTQCVPVQLVSGNIRNELNLRDNPINYKKFIKVCGNLEKYYGVPGVKAVTSYSFDTEGGSDGLIYQGLTQNADDWNFDNVLIDGVEYVWQWKDAYNALYASAYYNSTNWTTESYAYITLDLHGYNNITAYFDQCYKFASNPVETLTFVIREKGSTAWQSLSIPNRPSGTDWTYVNSGAINLSSFAGKLIEVGFGYKSSTTDAPSWEIKNLKIEGYK